MKTPPYVELTNQLRRDILSGKYGVQGALPSIRELAKESGLSNNTVNRAMSILVNERLLEQRGNAFHVTNVPVTITDYVVSHFERTTSQGREPFAENLAPVEIVTLPDAIADSLGFARGTQSVHRLRLLGEIEEGQKKPSRIVEYYYLIPLSDEQIQKLQDDPRLDLLAETHPVMLRRFDRISHRLATTEEANTLQISVTTPLMDFQSTVRDEAGNAVLFQQLLILGAILVYEYPFDNRPKS